MIRHVAYATDSRYVPHVLASLRSVTANSRGLINRATILALNVPKLAQNRLTQRVSDAEIRWIDVGDTSLFGLPTSHHLTTASYLRLLMPQLINEQFIYLDGDTVACDDLFPLLNWNISDCIGAAVENPGRGYQARLGLSHDTPYMNTGVLLVNSASWNSNRISELALEFAASFPNLICWADQCAINAVSKGRLKALPPRFNVQHSFFEDLEGRGIRPLTFTDADAIAARRSPVILHFSGSSKPWHLRNTHPLKYAYWRYRKWGSFDRLMGLMSIAVGRARASVASVGAPAMSRTD